MISDNKTLVTNFFTSKYYKNLADFEKYIHPDLKIDWNSSKGFFQFDYEKFKAMSLEMGKSFENMSPEFSHLIEENDKVCARFTYNVETMESQDLIGLADFFSVWEIKNNQLYRGYIMSQPCDDGLDGVLSFINDHN
ncbi:ester cyclase [Psychroflexus sp. YR1-1]|uniref:Ester cyclase n=1 Tax=Psychroflexus aurantiacus TaxID=2709310 RepID=A0A6B3R507_9FLAO|nr:ester cyclase [Psychroflexus aurantiacus]NEV94257.1 ester cyclase [Psychroflexus aurantiacus]